MLNVAQLKVMFNTGSSSDRRFAAALIKDNIDLISKEDLHDILIMVMGNYEKIFGEECEDEWDEEYFEDEDEEAEYEKENMNDSCV